MKAKMKRNDEFSTWVELMRWRACRQAEQRAVTWLSDGENEDGHLTYRQLDERARAIGAHLQSLGARGERVLLVYPSGLDYVAAFIGCLYAGAVAVPVYPPRANRNLLRLRAVVEDAQPAIALTTTAIAGRIEPMLDEAGLRHLPRLTTDDLQSCAQEWREPSIAGDTLAFLQYTSGSTATPKGVMVTHRNLLCNNRMIQTAFGQDEKSNIVIWLPLFHDMGLIGNLLQSFFVGSQSILMPPEAFLVKPIRWLQAISRYRAHTSGGPNFSYDLCARKISDEARATLDLSSWKIAFNGAEPVRHETLERFSSAFESCGFERSAFYPCYGLAEATLFVSGGDKSASPVLANMQAAALENHQVIAASLDDENARTLVGCGQSPFDQEIMVVDPATRERCESGHVGEIWLRGANIAAGYWNRRAQTERDFAAHLSGSEEGPFLRTGDLGFFQNGELFLTGRLKDLIIIAGRNHYPDDIEQTVAASHPALRTGCCAAFSVECEGEERVVIAAEIERSARRSLDIKTTIAAIRRAVSEQHDVRVHAVLLLQPASLPKTSSGKIQRHACRAGYREGTLDTIEERAPAVLCGTHSRLSEHSDTAINSL